ncbi:MAG: RagB/SusD family nutrient uptake outer membrane protein [Candidatus Cyclobacteriaceae bacterium M2_1C_046]
MNLKLIYFTCFSLIFIGCTGDLDVEPGDPLVSLVDEFYSEPEAYRQGLAAVYANLALTGTDGPGSSNIDGLDAGTSQYGRGLWNLQELPTDEAIWTWENDPGLRELNRVTWSAENVILRGMFGRVMTSVAFANEYLRQTSEANLDRRGVSADLRDEIAMFRAEARFLRALSYYHMMDLFGRAPFVTENDPVGAFRAPQYTRPELFDFIESELLEILPEMAEPLQNEYARADKAAAWMLLAKIYLNAEVYINENHYDKVITYTENIINSNYQLASNYLEVFMADNDQGEARREIIFPIVSDGITTQNYGPTTVIINGQIGSQEANGAAFGVNAGGWGGALRVTEEFSETFLQDAYTNDDRNTLITEDRTIDISSIGERETGYIVGKFSNLTSTGVRGSSLDLADTDFPMFRLADAYLMYAEAYIRGGGGDATTAAGYINQLRIRADNPDLVTVSDLTLELIIDERLVELYWEAHRRQDLIRFNLFTGAAYLWDWKGNAPNGIPIGSFRSLYPVPEISLSANPNLNQNPGY